MKKTLLIIAIAYFHRLSATDASSSWSSQDPASIPIAVRNMYYEKGNLVPNSSFELGEASSTELQFKLHGWETIGADVKWVDRKRNPYHDSDICTGDHAIKIAREMVNETDTIGDGVMSDYIEVIPGNYTFYYSVRLQKVYSQKARTGTKLADAIDVRVQFYDKDKRLISGNVYFPYLHGNVDNTYKGYTFSNFWNVEDFDWGKVLARTYNYCFSEGDTPDNVRYVKLFLGLKGRGTMWIDDIEFQFSKWNFTAKERLDKYVDNTYSMLELLIPKPKFSRAGNQIALPSQVPSIILIPEMADSPTKYAAELLQAELLKFSAKAEIVTTYDEKRGSRPLFSIGKTSIFLENEKQLNMGRIFGKQQGYIITTLPDDKNTVFCVGNSSIGDYYAIATLIQLIDKRTSILYNAEIVDYPDFLGRPMLFMPEINSQDYVEQSARTEKNVREVAKYKLNRLYNYYGFSLKMWKDNPRNSVFAHTYRYLGDMCKTTGVVDLAFVVHPYWHLEFEENVMNMTNARKSYFQHSSNADNQALIDVIKVAMDSGAKKVMLMSDDLVPHETDNPKLYSLWTPQDKSRFVNLANAHAFTINLVFDWLSKNYPGTRLEFCPPYYLNEFLDRSRGWGEAYFRDLMPQIPLEIAIVWSGNTVRSLSIDMADIERYKQAIGNRFPMLWDNTLYARMLSGTGGGYAAYYPGKVKMCNIFEPYDIDVPKEFYKFNDGREIFINGGLNEVYKFKYATVADCLWNGEDYDADFALWKALVQRVGKENGIRLIEFNDSYVRMLEVCMHLERSEDRKEWEARGKQYVAELTGLMDEVALNMNDNQQLIEELQSFAKGIADRFAKLQEDNGHNTKKILKYDRFEP